MDTDPDIRLARRLSRDITERGRDLDSVLKQYMKFVKPSYDHCIAPTMRHADIIVPRGMNQKLSFKFSTTHNQHRFSLDFRQFELMKYYDYLQSFQPGN